jgi:long-chain acyl-CoA synthetase
VGPFLISPNHQSYLDAFLLVGTLPYRTFRLLFFVGASEYFATPLMRRIARLVNVVPVDPDANLVRAMQAGAFGLRHGRVLVLFPEGERSPDGTVKTFKKGASILSTHLGVPIVPVAIHGVFEIWPRGRGLRLSRLLPFTGTRARFSFGAPVSLEALGAAGAVAADRYARLTAALRDAVVGLWAALDGGVDGRVQGRAGG